MNQTIEKNLAMAQYHHVTSYNFFGSPEEDINYLHAAFDRVKRKDPMLTNICYSVQADYHAEIFFEAEIAEGEFDHWELMAEYSASDIAENPAVKVFIVDGTDFVCESGTLKLDLGSEFMENFLYSIGQSKSINEIKFINCHIDMHDDIASMIEELPRSINVNFENCQLSPTALALVECSGEKKIYIRIAKCSFEDENGFVNYFKDHFLMNTKNVSFIVFDKCNFSGTKILELTKIASDMEKMADTGLDATEVIKIKVVQ